MMNRRTEIRSRTSTGTPGRPARRGSVLILVAGILVLLLIVGFSFLSRMQSERQLSVAIRNSAITEDRGHTLGRSLARIISEGLFVRPVDTGNPNAFLALDTDTPQDGANDVLTENPNHPRLAIDPTAVRYGRDLNAPWNGAPYGVHPWTNWPDYFFEPTMGVIPRSDDILGNPGTNDHRWLASLEPARWPLANGYLGVDGDLTTPDDVEVYSHWLHMTNLMRAGSGWVIVPDISDIEGQGVRADNNGLSMQWWDRVLNPAWSPEQRAWAQPVEQWLPHTGTRADAGVFLPRDFKDGVNAGFGKSMILTGNANAFWARWQAWFLDYVNIYTNGYDSNTGMITFDEIPANRYRLADCWNDTGGPLEPGERPEDEFTPGTPRWHISRILADADGDGWTDSFWHLAPVSVGDETRTLVAVRIIDAAGMVNLNVGTQFVRAWRNNGDMVELVNSLAIPRERIAERTRGWTPSDLALHEFADGADLAGTGFLTIGYANAAAEEWPEHWETVFPDGFPDNEQRGVWGALEANWDPFHYWNNDPSRTSLLEELGTNLTPAFLQSTHARLEYWKRSGLQGFDPTPPHSNATFYSTQHFTPFMPSDEFELRMFHGSNAPWKVSRLEEALQNNVSSNGPSQLFRAQFSREESTEYLDQLDVRVSGGIAFDEMLHDFRQRVTVFNSTRNDLVPPWLMWQYRWNPPGFSNGQPALDRFLARERQKLDLREIEQAASPADGYFTMPQRLAWRILTSLTDGPFNGAASYFGDPDGNLGFDDVQGGGNLTYEAATRAAAGLAANILSWRDTEFDHLGNRLPPYDLLENEAVRVPIEAGNAVDDLGSYHTTHRFLGMETQPFLVEAYIGHVYDSETAARDHPPSVEQGDNVVGQDTFQSTIVVVQIANPYDKPLDLEGFKLRVFPDMNTPPGDPARHEHTLTGTIAPHEARLYYDIDPGDPNAVAYLDALDIEAGVRSDSSRRFTIEAVTAWSNDREDYDDGDEARAIEIVRIVPTDWDGDSVPQPQDIVVDRIDIHAEDADPFGDDFEFGDEVKDLSTTEPTGDASNEPPGNFPWIGILNIEDDDLWTHWVRVSRDVERASDDTDSDGVLDRANPRYVFSLREVETTPRTHVHQGHAFDSTAMPDTWFMFDSGNPLSKPTRFVPVDAAAQPNFDELWDKDVNLPEGTGADEFITLDFPLQMLQKDGDFEQLGEVLNVFMFGHMLRFQSGTNQIDESLTDGGTIKTFSEFMIDGALSGMDRYVNRVRATPEDADFWGEDYFHSGIVGAGAWDERDGSIDVNDPGGTLLFTDGRHGFAALPAGARLLDSFVCDGAGYNAQFIDLNNDGTPGDVEDLELLAFGNAHFFSGKGTPGLLNVSGASREALRALPNAYKLAHDTNKHVVYNSGTGMWEEISIPHLDPDDPNYRFFAGRTRLAESIDAYRNGLGDPLPLLPDTDWTPIYGDRGRRTSTSSQDLGRSRGARGFESIGELALLNRSGRAPATVTPPALRDWWNDSWSVDFSGRNPLRNIFAADPNAKVPVNVSTDLNDPLLAFEVGLAQPEWRVVADSVAGDVEERNLLFSGISNLVTTRSDSFIVYFRVRTVRRDPTTGLYDGTDRDSIVDDTRYVMLVDRSRVESPTDEPRIVLLERVQK